MIDKITAKIGETGKTITVILYETDPVTGLLVPKNLTGYTNIVMQVEHFNGTVIMNQVPCVAAGNQSVDTGKIVCTTDITVAAHPALVAGDFRLEFSGLNDVGKKRYWPLNAEGDRTYGRFIVQDPLA